jgi:superfamily I DNA/RNA helicase
MHRYVIVDAFQEVGVAQAALLDLLFKRTK